jgi:hypothetical protein
MQRLVAPLGASSSLQIYRIDEALDATLRYQQAPTTGDYLGTTATLLRILKKISRAARPCGDGFDRLVELRANLYLLQIRCHSNGIDVVIPCHCWRNYKGSAVQREQKEKLSGPINDNDSQLDGEFLFQALPVMLLFINIVYNATQFGNNRLECLAPDTLRTSYK